MAKELPSSWGKDSLTSHIDIAIDNIFATSVKNKTEYPYLPEIDGCYHLIAGALNNPPGFLEGFFLMRSHAAYRGSAMLAMSGHNPETYPVIRNCLENALYALHINQNEGLDVIWLNRHENEKSEKTVRSEFSHGNVIKTLQNIDEDNYNAASIFYKRTIDYGAHPNERSMTGSMSTKEEGKNKYFMQDYLSGGTMIHRQALKTCAQIGLCSLLIFERIYTERFAILGITERINNLKAQL